MQFMNSIYRGNFSNETQLKIYLTDVNKTDFYTKTCCTLCMNTVAAHYALKSRKKHDELRAYI